MTSGMLVGHVAVGFAAKRFYPHWSLGTLVFAAMLADVLWCVLMLAGIEHVTVTGGRGAANYFHATDIAWSHSLATGAVWASAVVMMRRVKMRRLKSPHYTDPRSTGDSAPSWVLAVAVLSHWVLDVIAHTPDMPLAPGTSARLGLGLWTSIPATLLVEGGFWVLALALFRAQRRTRSVLGALVLWSGAAFLTLAWYNNIAGPPPPDARSVPIASLVFFLLIIGWAFWVNRL